MTNVVRAQDRVNVWRGLIPLHSTRVDVEKIFGIQERINDKKKICYARVSSEKQNEDLNRQCEYLRQKCSDYELIKDIRSGLNWKRKGFTSILEQSYRGDIEEVVVTRKVFIFYLYLFFNKKLIKNINII